MENKPLSERERIDALVFRLGISIRQLAKIVDMNENTFYHITDNSRFGISERTASKICYNLDWEGCRMFFDWHPSLGYSSIFSLVASAAVFWLLVRPRISAMVMTVRFEQSQSLAMLS